MRPGPKAASRVGIRTGVIAQVSLCDFSLEQLWRLPVLPILIGSVQSTLLRRQLSLFLGNLDKDGRLPECVSSRRCDGVIFFSKPPTTEAAAGFRKSLPDLPTVWCFRDHADEEHRFDHIFYDNSAVGPIAAEYLASHGHRKVAFFNTDPLTPRSAPGRSDSANGHAPSVWNRSYSSWNILNAKYRKTTGHSLRISSQTVPASPGHFSASTTTCSAFTLNCSQPVIPPGIST